MKAILIDALNCRVKEIQIKGDLQSYYQAIGCDLVQVGYYLDKEGDVILVDEEGLLKYNEHFFSYRGQIFSGNGLIIGTDAEGESASCLTELSDIIKDIEILRPYRNVRLN